jgi:RNA-binding protein
MLNGKRRAFLRGMANDLDPVFQVGKGGISEEMCLQIGNCLEARELIKLSVLENSGEDPKEVLHSLAAALQAEPVAVTGKKIILYRASEKKPVIELP